VFFEGRTPAPTAGAVSKPAMTGKNEIKRIHEIGGFDTAEGHRLLNHRTLEEQQWHLEKY
jgi:hypothetical protein